MYRFLYEILILLFRCQFDFLLGTNYCLILFNARHPPCSPSVSVFIPHFQMKVHPSTQRKVYLQFLVLQRILHSFAKFCLFIEEDQVCQLLNQPKAFKTIYIKYSFMHLTCQTMRQNSSFIITALAQNQTFRSYLTVRLCAECCALLKHKSKMLLWQSYMLFQMYPIVCLGRIFIKPILTIPTKNLSLQSLVRAHLHVLCSDYTCCLLFYVSRLSLI